MPFSFQPPPRVGDGKLNLPRQWRPPYAASELYPAEPARGWGAPAILPRLEESSGAIEEMHIGATPFRCGSASPTLTLDRLRARSMHRNAWISRIRAFGPFSRWITVRKLSRSLPLDFLA